VSCSCMGHQMRVAELGRGVAVRDGGDKKGESSQRLLARGLPGMGVLLVGHGTADAAGIEEFHQLVEQVVFRCAGVPVEPSFLAKAEPTINDGVARLAERGVRQIVVMPVLLFAAGHAKRDIPLVVARAVAGHTGMTARIARPLGCHRRIVALLVERFEAAVAGHGRAALDRTVLLLVGRGSSDREATDGFHHLAHLCGQAVAPVQVQGCFLAMAEPSLAVALTSLARGGHRRVVVQPHLLFRGRLRADLVRQVKVVAATAPDCQWLVADHLGPAPSVVAAVVDRMARAVTGGGVVPTCWVGGV
jgi:sirohydrochlorin cobaltochelatase